MALLVFLFLSQPEKPQSENTVVAFENDTQIITVSAKGGYYPSVITAKANKKTVLRMMTKGTFDCSAAFTIPSIGYREFLPNTGTTDISIPPQEAGNTINATCTMGMYSLKINFQ